MSIKASYLVIYSENFQIKSKKFRSKIKAQKFSQTVNGKILSTKPAEIEVF